MTLSRDDVRAASGGPTRGGVPLPSAEVDRITAVLNSSSSHGETGEEPVDGPVAAGAAQRPLDSRPVSRHQVLSVMKRFGASSADVQAARAALPDRIDPLRDQQLLADLGLSPGPMMDRLGSSP